MTEVDLAIAADDNLASTWATLGRAMGADVVDDGPLTLVATGLPLAVFNGAYIRSATNAPEHAITEAVRFFADRNLPWLLWARPPVATSLLDAGRAIGLRNAGGPPAMGMSVIREHPATPAELSIEIARTTDALQDHASMLGEGFGMPDEFVERLIRPALLDVPNAAAFVGYVDGQPASCSLLATSGTTAGVYNVATPERYRRRGYGEAMTWAAIAEGARRGCTQAILQASDAGYPVYREMGFVDLGRYVQLEGPPANSTKT
jgi:GNAT superfamily N-acetyltransferase